MGSASIEFGLYVLILVVIVLALVQFFSGRAFRARALSLAARLRDGPKAADLSGLPVEVTEYARRAGAEPGTGLRVMSLVVDGEERAGGTLRPFEGWQVMALGRGGYFSEVSRAFGSWPRDRMIEALIAGEGLRDGRRLVSLILDRAGGPDMTLAAAYRYLADLPWAPDAMIGNPALTWSTKAEGAVLVSLPTPAGEARAGFVLDEAGDIRSMSAADVPDGRGGRADWRASYDDYDSVGPRRLPRSVEITASGPAGTVVLRRARLREVHLSP